MSASSRKEGGRGRFAAGVEKGRVRVHDPFELIRWLALSQPDPRKALAELVQNSLDAGAHRVHITRLREKKQPCLKIWDDGEGVIPEMDRPNALRYIATHIGHSRKRRLSPQQRLELMTQGQYGIGLLGFWSLGEALEIRSRVPGQPPHRLILYRDRPDYVIELLRGRLDFAERSTEVVVIGLHREAMPVLGARRASDYLASELRGQILARRVDLVIEDRMARGRSLKRSRVRPRRFVGERIPGLGPLEIRGYPPIRLEIYVTGERDEEARSSGIMLYASGTLVAEDFDELAPLGLDHLPWTDARLTGLVDFPALRVAPGGRRGVVPDEAAGVLADALRPVEPLLKELLEARERERARELDRNLIRDLQRAFRDFYRQQPRYTMLPVRSPESGGEGGEAGPGRAGPSALDTSADAEESASSVVASESPADLFPPGPLESVEIRPSPVTVACGDTRRVAAKARDGSGRPLAPDAVDFTWELWGNVAALETAEGSAARVRLSAGDHPGEGILSVLARSVDRVASEAVPVLVVAELEGRGSDEGIPEPELVDQPGALWRSRIVEGRWQVNAGHRDYRAIADQPSLKLRYLAWLFAKEVVLRSSQDPRLEAPLEQLVEVAAYADRRLAERRSGRRRGQGKG